MIYLPACFVVLIFVLFQFGNSILVDKGGTWASVKNQYGEVYDLQPIMYIGGSYAEINLLDDEEKPHGDLPNIAEIRYEDEDYIIKNMDEECELTIKRGTQFLSVKTEKEIALRNQDTIFVAYRDISISYGFSWG